MAKRLITADVAKRRHKTAMTTIAGFCEYGWCDSQWWGESRDISIGVVAVHDVIFAKGERG